MPEADGVFPDPADPPDTRPGKRATAGTMTYDAQRRKERQQC
jgi:hypothetical protein